MNIVNKDICILFKIGFFIIVNWFLKKIDITIWGRSINLLKFILTKKKASIDKIKENLQLNTIKKNF